MDKSISANSQICPPPINNTDTYLGVNELSVNEQERKFLRRLGSFTAPYLQEKLLADKQFKSEAQFAEAFVEFKKFVAVVKLSGKSLTMTSKAVDTIWHQFILFTRHYHAFCNEFLGKYLHHLPKTSFTSLAPNGRSISESCIQNTLERYIQLGEVRNLIASLFGPQRSSHRLVLAKILVSLSVMMIVTTKEMKKNKPVG